MKLFLVEEIRLRRSFSSSLSMIIFPEVTLMGALAGYIFLPQLVGSFTYDQIHMAILGSLFMFGVSMGGIAFLGKDFIERSLGPVTMIAASISYHPVDEKKMYLSYFLHDLVFYLFLILLPMTGGLLLGTIIRPMPVDRFLIITAAQWSTFLMGLSLSMLVSSLINNPKRRLLLLVPISILPLVAIQVLTSDVQGFIPGMLAVTSDSWPWAILTVLLTMIYVTLGVLAFDGSEIGYKRGVPGSYKKMLSFARIIYPRDTISRSLFAREMIGLIRGRAYVRIGFSLFFPLLVMTGMVGLISGMEGIPVTFNLTFFAVMVSFFAMSTYAHLSNIDFLEFDQTIPIDTPKLIKVKVRVYLLLSLPMAIAFLVIMSIIMGDMEGLLYGLPLVLVAVPYMGYVTAYLTGLWTNSLLFDPSVFLKYIIFTVLPLMFSTILSLMMVEMFLESIIGIAVILAMGIAAIKIISGSIDRRWKNMVLSSTGIGFRD